MAKLVMFVNIVLLFTRKAPAFGAGIEFVRSNEMNRTICQVDLDLFGAVWHG